MRLRNGCSCRHGPHHEAQNSSTVFRLRNSTVTGAPSSVWPESAAAGTPTLPDGGATETSCCSEQDANKAAVIIRAIVVPAMRVMTVASTRQYSWSSPFYYRAIVAANRMRIG